MRVKANLWVFAALAAVGCGSSSKDGNGGGGTSGGSAGTGGGGKNVSAFVGVWSATSGTSTTTCPGVQPSTDQVTDPETWAMGTTSDLVQTIPGTSCVFHANVTASTAMGVAGQTCTINSTADNGDQLTQKISVNAYTFSLSADGSTANESLSGAEVVTDNTTGLSVNCMFTQSASYAKQ